MKWMKGMFLLLAANILIMVTLSITVPIISQRDPADVRYRPPRLS